MQQMQLGQEQQAFGQNLNANNQNWNQANSYANFQNQLRQQQVNEGMMQRGFGLNEINALLQGQGVQMPNFGGFNMNGQGQTPDLTSAAQNQYNAAYQQQQNKNAATGQIVGAIGTVAGGFFGGPAGAAAGGALGNYVGSSDRRLKKDITVVGKDPRGFKRYSFRFIGETGPKRTGVMAQELQRVMPKAVVKRSNGSLAVNYSML